MTTRRPIAFVAIACVIAACGSTVGKPSPSPVPGTATPPPSSSSTTPVRFAQMLGPSTGWVLTDRDLLRTSDETTWTKITPPGATAETLQQVFFASEMLGWAVQRAGSNAVQVVRTVNGGGSWSTVSEVASGEGAMVNGVQFIDAQNGWLMARSPSSSNFSVGRLFRTIDGGSTWSPLAVPIADAFRFVTPQDGWLAGGPAGDQLFATRDGGTTWSSRSVTVPAAFAGARPAFTPPRFFDPSVGVLPVSFTGAGTSGYGIYGTVDGGLSWSLVLTFAATSDLSPGVSAAMTFDLGPPASAVVALRDRVELRRSADRGRSWQQTTTSGLPASPSLLDYIDGSNGWAVAVTTSCPQKQSCVTTGGLHTTKNGGGTWLQLRP